MKTGRSIAEVKNGQFIGEEDSKRITSLRFLLMVLVIFIHNNGNEIANTVTTEAVKLFFSEIIARVAVPLFFFLSGYLLFCKPRQYKKVLQTKIRTLLIPYLIWNSLVIAMFWVGQNAPFLSRFFGDENNRIASYSLYQWLDAFLGLNYQGYPAAYQLWFLRDLMILILLYPLGKKLVDLCPVFTLVLLFLVWGMQWRIVFFSSEAAMFFMLGYYAVKYQVQISSFDTLRFKESLLIYGFIVILECILVLQEKDFLVLHKCGILVGCILWLQISGWLAAQERRYQMLQTLSVYSFFVYASHEPLLTLLRKVWSRVLPLEGTAMQLLQYFGLIFLVLFITVVIGVCIRKLSPKIYGLITGGRVKVIV